jgi:hypothetical protein
MMTFRTALYPIALAWTALNIGGIGYAAYTAEPMHAMVHGVLAVAFGLWAVSLRKTRAPEPARDVRLEVLEDEVSELQRELNETRQGLNFAEQLLASKRPPAQPIDAQRPAPKPPDTQRASPQNDASDQ